MYVHRKVELDGYNWTLLELVYGISHVSTIPRGWRSLLVVIMKEEEEEEEANVKKKEEEGGWAAKRE